MNRKEDIFLRKGFLYRQGTKESQNSKLIHNLEKYSSYTSRLPIKVNSQESRKTWPKLAFEIQLTALKL